MNYKAFLKTKAVIHEASGLSPVEPHPILFPFQRDIVKWALRQRVPTTANRLGSMNWFSLSFLP